VLKRFGPILALTAVCWLVFVVNNLVLDGHLTQFGIRPRHLSSLPGIIWSPFLHTSFRHLAANSLPLLILGGIICARSRSEFALITAAGIFLGGALTWLMGRSAYHVGASGLIFCFFGYLSSLAYFKRNIPTLILSAVCLLGYGGILRGILPTSAAVSWEGHLAGLITGITLAWLGSAMRRSAGEPGNPAIPKLPEAFK
jgi:membrane associated rhomboid family serine protease